MMRAERGLSEEKIALEARLSNLMIEAQRGHSDSYEALLRESSPIIERYLRARLGRHESIGDVLQETLLAVHKARATYDQSRPFIPWLISITKYKYIDFLRKWSKQASREVVDEQVLENIVATDSTDVSNTPLSEELNRALAALSERQRETVMMLKVEGFSVKEISQKTGQSESAVKVTAHRAYKILRKKLRSI
jgi:RNA polymerase sigma-70 factor (ECF subfamily)